MQTRIRSYLSRNRTIIKTSQVWKFFAMSQKGKRSIEKKYGVHKYYNPHHRCI